MKSFEFTAKTVEKAIKEGLESLGKKQEEVDIKIINEGGLFKKAKIVINIEEEIQKTTFVAAPQETLKVVEEKNVEQESLKQDQQPAVEGIKETEKVLAEETEQYHLESNEENKEDIVEQKSEEINANEEKQKLYEERHYENNKTSVEFIEGLLKVLKIEANVCLEEKRDASEIKIEAEDAGKVIGYRGESLSAIQYIANTIELAKNPHAKRVVVDAGDYKTRREESLRALAIRVAGKVESTGRAYKFEPMSAFERRIIHTELHNYSSVETHSEGEEPYRRLIVTKKK